MDSYPCLTDVIATFHFLSVSSAAMGGYPNIILIIFCLMFFFNRNIMCNLSISAFMASASNSIMKLAVFHFPCLKDSILYLASAAFVLSLKVILISFMKSSQFWVSSSLSSSLSFFYAYITAIPPLRQARITVILLSVSITLLLLRYNCIPLHQSSNFVQFPSNHPGSGTMLFSMTACMFLFVADASAADISISVCLYSLEAFSVICRDSSHYDNVSILFILLELVLVLFRSMYYTYFI